MKTAALSVLLLVGLAAAAVPVRAAETPRKARVAGGADVTLVGSGQSAAQWAAKRPRASDLRPRARGTFD